MTKLVKHDYTPASGNSVVLVIEAVYPLNIDYPSDEDGLLESLREFGAAEIIEKKIVRETFDEASSVLARRAAARK